MQRPLLAYAVPAQGTNVSDFTSEQVVRSGSCYGKGEGWEKNGRVLGLISEQNDL